ncbi:MAG: type II secretion system F family protein [Patescibacteria group bacterium]|jgi:type IV pilus assembly protein PilC
MNFNLKFLDKYQKVPAAAKIFLLQNISVMLKAGISLSEALKSLADQTKNRKLKNILLDVGEKIKGGGSFSESMMPYQKDFGELFINMIRAGEASGRLEDVLMELYIQSKKDYTLVTKIRNALTYPVIIIIAMITIASIMAVFVLPSMIKMFDDMNVELPLVTRLLIMLSHFIQKDGIYVLIGAIILIIVFIRTIKSKTGKHLSDSLILKIPVISGIIKQINLARASRSLSALIQTEIAIVETLTITSRVLGNSVYKLAFLDAAEKVKKGQKLASIFKEYPDIFPSSVIQMISVGEETGSLDNILKNLADFYEEEVTETMNNLPTIIEPVLMILIGIAVGGIAIAVLMPMYSLTQSM